jgi:hypothetical protein
VLPDVELSALQLLTNLQTLNVWDVGDSRVLNSLRHLTQLRSLSIKVAGEVVQPHMLVVLTQLQALTWLSVLADHYTPYAEMLDVRCFEHVSTSTMLWEYCVGTLVVLLLQIHASCRAGCRTQQLRTDMLSAIKAGESTLCWT